MFEVEGKSILVTGGTGFLGKNLVQVLKARGAKVVKATGRDYDLSIISRAEELFNSDVKYDLIVHAAAFQGAGDFPLRFPADQFRLNNLIHTNTLDCWHRFQPQARLVGIGSTCSYPGNLTVLREEDYLTGPLHESVDIYGLTKCNLQKGIEAYKRQYKLKGTTVVFATLFGPHDEFDIEKSHVVSALIKKFCDAKENGLEEVEVWGDGTQTRELIFVMDQIEGLLSTCEYDGDLINIGTGVETSIRDLANLLKQLTEFSGEIVYNTDRFVGVKKKVLDISRAKRLYGWSGEQTPFSVALKETIQWYRETYL